ncbi:RNA polymerase sigma factor RpoD/SigA [Prolixibacteraceae bacterium JC049]|nr:RNA polymerase sigma factor RpoD/SigA [Prolixibacteraceae bacterium JC049]
MKKIHPHPGIPTSESKSFISYIKDIRKIKLLSESEEVELTYRCKKGNLKALNELIVSNLRFVITVAKQYQNQGLSIEDLINEGNIGLITAANRFDPTKGFKFISYAVWWIRQAILKAITNKGRPVRLPANRINQRNKILRAEDKLTQKLKRDAELSDLSKELGVNEKIIQRTLGNHYYSISFEEQQLQFSDINSFNKKVDEKFNVESLRVDIDEHLRCLGHFELDVVERYYGLNSHTPQSLESIATHKKVSKERIRQIKREALRKIRANTSHIKLREYL